jgi:hypothetical protein
MKLRRFVIATHRDLGYLFAGLTVIYAISGVAVNHVHHWNPNYIQETRSHDLGVLPEGSPDELAAEVLRRMEIDEKPISAVRMGPEELKVFLDERALTVTLPGGQVVVERVTERPVIRQTNYLHLNHGKGIWTWIADIYALGLLVLALTGIFIIPGKKGLGGRGRWLLLIGLAVPLVYLLVKLS